MFDVFKWAFESPFPQLEKLSRFLPGKEISISHEFELVCYRLTVSYIHLVSSEISDLDVSEHLISLIDLLDKHSAFDKYQECTKNIGPEALELALTRFPIRPPHLAEISAPFLARVIFYSAPFTQEADFGPDNEPWRSMYFLLAMTLFGCSAQELAQNPNRFTIFQEIFALTIAMQEHCDKYVDAKAARIGDSAE